MNLVIFESGTWAHFAPLCLTRPIFCLTSGFSTLLERQLRRLRPERLSLWVRPQFAEFCRQRVAPFTGVPTTVNEPLDKHPVVMLNAATLRATLPEGALAGPYVERASHGDIGFTFLSSPGLSPDDVLNNSERWQQLTAFTTHECRQSLAGQVADLIHGNEHILRDDFAHLQDRYSVLPSGPFHALKWEDIRVGPQVQIAPGVVLDASHGPIILDTGANIGANSVIEGPCCIGPGCTIRPLSLIRGGVTLGPGCKVGGEVGESILQGNSNKAHDGYLGHSFLGEWVNLGAGTTTSNLKNTYGDISLKIGSRQLATGRMFMGALIGDYTKTAIGTRLMGGTYIGVSSMLAVSNHGPRFTPSFTFMTDDKQEPYQFRKAVEVATRVYARRKRPWTGLDESILLDAHELAATVEA